MRSRILAVLFVCITASPAMAQDPDARFEISGQYSYFNADLREESQLIDDDSTGLQHGWSATFGYFASEDVTLIGEYTTQYGTQYLGTVSGYGDATMRVALGGARFGERYNRLQYYMFIQGGMLWASIDAPSTSVTDSSLAATLGGGLDFMIGRFGIRLAQGSIMYAPALRGNPALRVTTGAFYIW
jgi:hypothetical protein